MTSMFLVIYWFHCLNLSLHLKVLTDSHPKVQSAGQTALQQVSLGITCSLHYWCVLLTFLYFPLLGWECDKESRNISSSPYTT
jgi:hypothetical protein